MALHLHDVVGEHHRLNLVGVLLHQQAQGFQGVSGGSNVADFPLCLGLGQGLIGPVGAKDLVKVLQGQVVNLVQVDIVGLKVSQADANVLLHSLTAAGHGLGGQDELVPAALQGSTQIFLRYRVAPGGVDEIDAELLQLVHHCQGVGGVGALDGDAAKGDGGHLQSGVT